ncbi:MAG: hypothetical protein ACOYB3_00730 [Azonexus sp.]
MGTQQALAAELAELTTKVAAIGVGIAALNTKVSDLEDALGGAGNTTPEVQAAVEALRNEINAATSLIPLVPVVEDPPLPPAD